MEKTHHAAKPDRGPGAIEGTKKQNGRSHRGDESDGKRFLATDALAQIGEGKHSEKRTGVLDDAVDPAKRRLSGFDHRRFDVGILIFHF